MKKLIFAWVLGISVVACSGRTTSSSTETEKSTGAETWVIVKAEGSMPEENIGTQYIFEGNKLTLRGGGISTPGTFKMSKDTLIYDMPTYKMQMKYIKTMKGKQMVLTMIDSDQVFYLIKQ